MRQNFIVLFYISFLLVAGNTFAQAPHWSWATGSESTSGSVSAPSIASNNSGYSAICGSYSGQMTIGPLSLQPTGASGSNFYLSLYAPDGAVKWTSRVGGTVMSHGEITNVAMDNNTNVYVFGYYQDSIEFGDTTMRTPGFSSIFASEYDSLGHRLWVKTIVRNANPFDDNHQAIYSFGAAFDKVNRLFIVGNMTDSADCNGIMIKKDGANLFAAAFESTNGNTKWAAPIEGNGECTAETFATDKNTGLGYLYCTGQTNNGHAFISMFSSEGGSNIFDTVTGGFSLGRSISVSPTGIIYVGGSFSETIEIASHSAQAAASYFDGFIAAFDNNLQSKWVTGFGGDRVDQCFGITSDNEGNAYVTGYFELLAHFGNTTLTNSGSLSNICFLAKYDSVGNAIWAVRPESGSNGANLGLSVTTAVVNGKTELFLGGAYADTIHFGSRKIGPSGGGAGYYIAAMEETEPASVSMAMSINNQIAIYPNPSKRFVTIRLITTKSEPIELLITDALGRTIVHSNNYYAVGHQDIQLDVSSFSTGVYNCSIRTAEGVASASSLVIE